MEAKQQKPNYPNVFVWERDILYSMHARAPFTQV